MEEILILGVVIGQEQVQMENEKVKAVKEWSTFTKIKEVECYGSRLKGLRQETTLVLSNTRELDRVPSTK